MCVYVWLTSSKGATPVDSETDWRIAARPNNISICASLCPLKLTVLIRFTIYQSITYLTSLTRLVGRHSTRNPLLNCGSTENRTMMLTIRPMGRFILFANRIQNENISSCNFTEIILHFPCIDILSPFKILNSNFYI